MQVQGNTSGSIKSQSFDVTGTITAFSLYNKSAGAIVCSVGIVTDDTSTDRYMFSFNLAATGSAGSSVYQETDITLIAGAKVLLVVAGSTDYLFQID